MSALEKIKVIVRGNGGTTDKSQYPAPPEVYNWRIYLLTCSACMGAAMQGYDGAFIGGTLTLPAFQHRFQLDIAPKSQLDNLKANIVSTFQAGGFFGALFAYFMTEKFGRRWTLVSCGIIFNIGVILQVASTGSLAMLYVGRILTGIATGAQSCVVPVYIAEWSPPAIRGRLVSFFEVFLQSFTILGFWVSYACQRNISGDSPAQWQVPFAVQFIPGTLLAVMMLFQPESARWLLMKGRQSQATAALSRIRHLPVDHEYVDYEVRACLANLAQEATLRGGNPSWFRLLKEVFGKHNARRLALGVFLMFSQNLTGVNAINYFSPGIFSSIGFSGPSVTLLATGVYGIVKGVANGLFNVFFLDHVGRRRTLLVGAAGVMVSMFYLAAYSAISHSFEKTPPRDAGAYIAIIMVYVFGVLYGFSWCGIPWVFTSEVFPNRIRSLSFTVTTLAQWLSQFMIVYSVPYMISNITYGTFLLFGCSVTVAAVVVYFFLPETKGLSMEEMEILFGQKGSASRMRQEADRIIQERVAIEAQAAEGIKEGGLGKSAHVEDQAETV